LLSLGDSYTIGEGVSPSERWPALFVELANEQGVSLALGRIIAKTGWTTAELIHAIDESQESLESLMPWRLVSLLIGVNNQYRGYAIDLYHKEMLQLVHRAIEFAGGEVRHVVVLSIPDYGVTPFGKSCGKENITSEIRMYNAVARDICKEAGVEFVDVTECSLKAQTDSSLLTEDRLHYSGKMHMEWAQLVLERLRSMSLI